MKWRPLRDTPAYFHGILSGVLAKNWPSIVDIAGLRAVAKDTGDPEPRIDVNPRLSIMLSGRQRYSVPAGESRREVVLRPGQCRY